MNYLNLMILYYCFFIDKIEYKISKFYMRRYMFIGMLVINASFPLKSGLILRVELTLLLCLLSPMSYSTFNK